MTMVGGRAVLDFAVSRGRERRDSFARGRPFPAGADRNARRVATRTARNDRCHACNHEPQPFHMACAPKLCAFVTMSVAVRDHSSVLTRVAAGVVCEVLMVSH